MDFWHYSPVENPIPERYSLKPGHITLADVAKRARVSTSTASRALAGLAVNKKNHDKVQKAAKELGYVMNEAARSLRNVKSMTIGLVFHELTGQFGIELLSSVSSRFDANGYCVFVATAQGDSDRYDKLVHRFLERRVDALLCVHGAGQGTALERLQSAGVPVVGVISKREGYKNLPLFAPSTTVATEQCVSSLKKLGHKDILVLRHSVSWLPLETFTKTARAAGMHVNIEALPDGPYDPTRTLEFCRTGDNSPTVIVTTQIEAAQILAAADQMQIAIPETLSLIAVRDRSTLMPITRVPLSIIYMDPQKIGVKVAERLLDRLNDGPEIDGDTFIEMGSWLERGTTGPAQKSKTTDKPTAKRGKPRTN